MATITLRPNSDILKNIEYPSGSHYTEVDEAVADDNSTYVQQSAIKGSDEENNSYYDHFGLENTDLQGVISKVTVYARFWGNAFTAFKYGVKTHNSIYTTIGTERSETWKTSSKEYITNPNTGNAWTWDEVNDLQAIICLEPWTGGSYSTATVRCTQVYIEITYTPANVPTVITTTPVTTKDHESATLEGKVTDADGQSITERGFEYQKITAGSTVDATSSAGQKKLYVADTTNFTVGDKIVINRGGDREEDAEIDAITTGDYLTLVDNLTYEHTDVQADAVEICGTTNTVKKESDDFGIGTFDLEVTGLEPYVTYRYRAYAVNQSGTGYGDWESFTTDKTTPTVVTNAVTTINTTTATANGNITATGGEDCSERGFQYGLTKVATWTVKDEVGGYGTGAYSKGLTGLSPNTIYWIRAYATNSIGTSYGDWVEFQTAVTGATPTNTRITLTGDVSGYVAQMHDSENDLDYPYEGYFVLATDLSETNTLILYKRLLDVDSYFRKETSGSVTISIKCDHESDWHEIGDIDLTGDSDIVLKHLASDKLGKHFQVRVSGKNAFRYLGSIFHFIVQGER